MISGLIKIIFYLIVFAVFFLGLVWVLLGMTPTESWERFHNQADNLTGRVQTLPDQMDDTAQDLVQSAESQVSESAENLNAAISRQANNLAGEL